MRCAALTGVVPSTLAAKEDGVPQGPAIKQVQGRLDVVTRGPGFIDVTRDVVAWLDSIEADEGLLTLFVRHTSASITIQENADPDVLRDLGDALDRLAPREGGYRHAIEGPDDMPGHIKSMLTAVSIGVPVSDGKAVLGKWQAIYLIEHRDQPHSREIVLHYLGSRRR
jgi:secondary thiamine-phosphate synthase enzyme